MEQVAESIVKLCKSRAYHGRRHKSWIDENVWIQHRESTEVRGTMKRNRARHPHLS